MEAAVQQPKYSQEDLAWIQANIGWLDHAKTGHPDSFWATKQAEWLFKMGDFETILLAWGNQTGKNDTVAEDWSLRVQGLHKISWKNLHPTDKIRTFRVCCEILPTDKGEQEKKNTVYPAILRRFPKGLLKKDVTIRNPVQTWRDPQGGPDFYIEYVSYGQTTQSQAGVQRKAIWIDEGPSYEFYIEQTRRLIAASEECGKADIIFSYTPTEKQSAWIFEDLAERARVIFRTASVRRRIYKRSGGKESPPAIEYTDSDADVAIIYASLLDNPVISNETAVRKIKELGDPDVQDSRGYGLFREISGKVYKDFNTEIHCIKLQNFFETGMPDYYKYARGIDYHSKNPWACVFIAISPQDEIFVWDEFEAPPDKMVTYDIAKVLAIKSRHYKYEVNKIDPLAQDKQGNTGMSPLEDLNGYFHDFKKDGLGTGAYWTSWDTKSVKGLDEFRKRLHNSKICGRPFNNTQVIDGKKLRLPTIWFSRDCEKVVESMKKWKWQDWKSRESLIENDPKGDRITERQQKFSHFPITIECLLKCPEVVRARFRSEFDGHRDPPRKSYFQARV